MSYLMIRNPGVADYRGFTLLGVSTTRYAGAEGTIGQFGSGSKLAIALLLRMGIQPVIICGNLKMEFYVQRHTIKGQHFDEVCVKYSGKDIDGATKNNTEDLKFTLQWGVQDWTKPSMALREFVSNAIDGSICAGGTYRGVEFEIVEKPRAKFGYTQVFLPLTDTVKDMYAQLGTMFLHYGSPYYLNKKCLPKRDPGSDKVLIYKKGVLACHCRGNSVFDYNLGDELTLDESRNASEWDVKYSIAKALRNADSDTIATILKEVVKNPEVWEAKLDACYLAADQYATDEVKEKRQKNFKEAWEKVAGPKGVVCSGSVALASFVQEKGFNPVAVEGAWSKVLESYDVPCESKVLNKNELEGKVVSQATPAMLDCTMRVWDLLEKLNLTNGKLMPEVEAFTSIMDGSCQTHGYYIPGGETIYLHTSLGVGKMMFKAALEECVHYITGSDDKSRDIQDFLFSLATEAAKYVVNVSQ